MPREHELYFGKTMGFVDNAGTAHANAFWHLEDFHINTNRREMYIRFTAYHSVDSFEAGESSLANVGGAWNAQFSGERYDRLIILYAEAVAGVAYATWSIAGQVADTPNTENGFESFFASASEILAPPEFQKIVNK